jgi:hypothetical protein
VITVTSIYNEKGQKIGEIAKSDCKPLITWVEFFIGFLGALITLHLMVMQ